MATTRHSASLRVGDMIRIRYKDHCLFKDSDASRQKPRVLEAFGRLDYQNDDYVRLVFEQYSEPESGNVPKVRSMGLVILKSTILELRRDEA